MPAVGFHLSALLPGDLMLVSGRRLVGENVAVSKLDAGNWLCARYLSYARRRDVRLG